MSSDEFHLKRKFCLFNLYAHEHQCAFGLSTNYGSYTRGLTDSWGSNFLTCLRNEQSLKLINILTTMSNIWGWTEREIIWVPKEAAALGFPERSSSVGVAGGVLGCSGCELWAVLLSMKSSLAKPGFWPWHRVLCAGRGWAAPNSNPRQGFRGISTHPKDLARLMPSQSHLTISSITLDWGATALLSINEKPTTDCSRVTLGPTHYHLKNKCTLNISKNILTHKMLSILFHHSSLLRDHCFHYMSLIRAPGSVLRPVWVHH